MIALAFFLRVANGIGLVRWWTRTWEGTYEFKFEEVDGKVGYFGDIKMTKVPRENFSPHFQGVAVPCDECSTYIPYKQWDETGMCVTCWMADDEQRMADRDRE